MPIEGRRTAASMQSRSAFVSVYAVFLLYSNHGIFLSAYLALFDSRLVSTLAPLVFVYLLLFRVFSPCQI